MFNPVKVISILQDVVYKTKLSGTITANPGTGVQTLLAYSRDTGELIGSAIWDEPTKTFELLLPNTLDERIFLTRIDNNGQYFAETYDRLSLCSVNYSHDSSFNNVTNNNYVSTNAIGSKQGLFSFPFNIIHENLKRINGTFSFPDNYKEGQFLVNGNYYPVGSKVNGLLYSDEGMIICDAEKSQNYQITDLIHSFDSDPFNDGSMIAAYPLIIDGKDSKRTRNITIEKTWRLARGGYRGTTDLPKIDPVEIPIVINRSTTTTIYFEFIVGSNYSTNTFYLLTIPNLMRITLYNASIYWSYLNPGVISETQHGLPFPSRASMALVIAPSGNDKLYINGTLATKAIVAPVTTNQEYFSFPLIRGDSYSSQHDVTLLGVAVFNRELTLSEIQSLETINRQKSLSSINYINGVVTKTDKIETGIVNQEHTILSHFLKDGVLGNKLGLDSWSTKHYGVTERANYITFNGTTALLYRTNTKDTSNIDIRIRFNAAAITSQCIWKIGNTTDGIAIGINSSSQLTLYARTGNTLTSVSIPYTLFVATWYVAVVSNGTFKLFSDTDIELGSVSNSLTIGTYSGYESIGGAYDGSPITGTSGNSGYFSGSISNLLIADKNTIGEYVLDSEKVLSVWIDDTELPVEVVKCDYDNDSLVLWTKIPELDSTGTTITIKESSTSSKVGVTESRNAQNVWNNDFLAVYHFGQNSKLIDSTINRFHGTLVGIDASNFTDHLTGSKLTLNGTDEYVRLPFPIISNLQRLSISSLFNPNTIANGDSLIDVALPNAADSGLQLSMQFDSSSYLNVSLTDNTDTSIGAIVSNAIALSTDHFLSVDYTGKSEVNGLSLKINGTTVDSDNSTGKRISSSNGEFTIGKDAYSANYYDGSISELFIRNKQMDSDFEKVMRLSVMDQLGTYTVQEGDADIISEWTPNELITALWLDASDDTTITTISSAVSVWKDKKTPTNAATQTIAASRPAYDMVNGINGKSVVSFDGTDDFLDLIAVPQALNSMIFAVVDTTNLQTSYRLLLNRQTSTAPYPPSIYLSMSNNNPGIYWGTGGTGDILTNTPYRTICIMCFTIKSGSVTFAVNGGTEEVDSTAETVLSNWININGSGSQSSSFKLGELLICNNISNADRQRIEGYLAHKWGLSSQLPVNHPYKLNAPLVEGIEVDPYWNNVSLLLPMNGINGSTLFQDLKGKTITAYGDTVLSSAKYKFGNSSAYFDGTGDYLLTTVTDLYNAAQFTIECWFNVSSLSDHRGLFFLGTISNNSNRLMCFVSSTGYLDFYLEDPTSAILNELSSSAGTIVINTWYHLAVVQTGGMIRVYLNGTQLMSATRTVSLNSSSDFYIGNARVSMAQRPFYGYIDEFRLTIGVARYTEDFIVSTKSLETSVPFYNIIRNDGFWYNTTLAMPMDIVTNNTNFVDLKGKTVTKYGDALLSLSKSKFGGCSAVFDGTGDYLTLPNSADINNFGTGDFTIECWVYFNSIATEQGIITCGTQWASSVAYALEIRSDGTFRFYAGNSVTITLISATGMAVVDKWYHLAATRNMGTTRLFVNGVIVASHTGSITISSASEPRVGMFFDGTAPLNGYIDDLRITKGVARYTENFIVPSKSLFSTEVDEAVDPYWDNVTLFLPMNGINNSTLIQDVKGKEIVAYGNATLKTDQYKFGVSSAYFDGTGDYLLAGSIADWKFLHDDNSFTIEFWVYWNSGTNNACIISTGAGGTGTGILVNILGTDNRKIQTTLMNGSVNYIYWTSSIGVANNAWTHVVFTYTGVSRLGYFYIDGIKSGQGLPTISGTWSSNSSSNPSYNLAIGRYQYSTPGNYFNGYIDDLRITRGVIRYTDSFNISTKSIEESIPFYNIIKNDSFWYNTVLAMPFNASQYVDFRGKALSLYNGANITESQFKFNGASISFDGTNDYATIPDSSDWDFGTGDFTIECYARFNANNVIMSLVDNYQGSANGWSFQFRATNTLAFGDGDTLLITYTSFTPTVGQWYHLAVTRTGGYLRLFINGTLVQATANSTNLSTSNNPLAIGYLNNSGGVQYVNGYIDDLRITKGVARYTNSFQLPTKSYFDNPPASQQFDQYWNNVVIAMPMEGTNDSLIFSDIKGNYITPFGNVKISTQQTKYGTSSAYFDGGGDYLSLGATHLTYDDFTVEFFVYLLSNTGNRTFVSQYNAGNSARTILDVRAGKLSISNGSNGVQSGLTTMETGQWYHVAFVRTGTTCKGYLNGVLEVTHSNFQTPYDTTTLIGTYPSSTTDDLYGYIDHLRITKGVARYTQGFIPENYFIDVEQDKYWDQTVLLCSFNGVNNSTSFIDIKGKTVSIDYGSPVISSSQGVSGGASVYLNGSSSLTIPNITDFMFGSGEFCIEFWFYANAYTANLYNHGAKEGEVWPINEISYSSIGKIQWAINYANSNTYSTLTSNDTFSLGVWHHVACVRQGNYFKIYVNGVQQAFLDWNISIMNSSYAPIIGAARSYSTRAGFFNGYIDDLRITKGVPRYTANFTPPNQPLGQYYLVPISNESVESTILFDIEPSIVTNTIKDVPIMLQLSDSSGLSSLDVTAIFTSIKENNTKISGLNPINSEFGFQKSSLSGFSSPYMSMVKGPRNVNNTGFKFANNVNSIVNITNCIARSFLSYSMTFSMWIRLDIPQNSLTELLLFGSTGANELQILHRYNGELVYRHYNTVYVIGYIRQNKWSHLMITRDAITKTIKTYINGNLVYTFVYTSSPAISTNDILIGGTTSAAAGCTLADIMIIDRVLDSGMLQKLYLDSKDHFHGISTSILYQDVPVLLGDNITSINIFGSSRNFYSLSSDKRTYYIFDTAWKPIVSDNPAIHGFTGETGPYYWDDDSSEWVFSRVSMEETISIAIGYEGNRMDSSTLNALSDFTSIYSSSVGKIHIAASFDSNGEDNISLDSIKINNKQYWISDPYILSDFCDIVSSSYVGLEFSNTVDSTTYWNATKVYCKLDNGSSWIECVNGTIPNIPVGFNTSGRSAIFKVVWDLAVWSTPSSVTLEVIIK